MKTFSRSEKEPGGSFVEMVSECNTKEKVLS